MEQQSVHGIILTATQIQSPAMDAPTVSLVVPMHDEAGNIAPLYQRIRQCLDAVGESWELVCVNDGSRDDTLIRLEALRAQDDRVVVVDLARNFGKEAALTAGLDHARGQVAIPLDADLQGPPELVPLMLKKWREGYDVVNAVRGVREGEGFLKRVTAHVFYRSINKLSDLEIPRDTGDFRLLSRPVLDALKQLPERRRFMKGLFAWVGFRTTEVLYRRDPRLSGKTKFNYWRLWNFALEGVTSFSTVPLRLSSYLGFIVSLCAFIYAVKIIAATLIFGDAVRGYPTLMVVTLFLGGVQLMALGVMGEYLGRVYEESKQRPIYLVRKVDRSTRMQGDDAHD